MSVRSFLSRRLWLGGYLALMVGTTALTARGDSGSVDRRTQAIARETMSPFCPGKTIDACPSPAARAWRADIRAWVARDVTSEEIHRRLQSRVPQFDLEGRPGRAWDWALPLGAFALMTGWLLWLLVRGRNAREQRLVPEEPQDDELDARLNAELRDAW